MRMFKIGINYMKTKVIISLFLFITFSSIGRACECFANFKGHEGYIMSFSLSADIIGNLVLLEITSTDSLGAKALIIKDYQKTFKHDSIFIENLDPGWQCGESTDQFNIGDVLIAIFHSTEYDNALSNCYESFINVTNSVVEAILVSEKKVTKTKWTIEEIEQILCIEINELK